MSIRIGVVGTTNGHAAIVAGFLNGWSEDAPTPVRAGGYLDPYYHFWQYQRTEQAMVTGTPHSAGSARVTKIWSAEHDVAEVIASACDIKEICSSGADACVDVDAVMVLSGDPDQQPGQAAPALDRGLPTFIDKPLASDLESCRAVFARARQAGRPPCFPGPVSGGQLSSKTLSVSSRTVFAEPIEAIYVKVPNRAEQYGIHAVEIANIFLGADVRQVSAVQDATRAVALLTYASGQTAVIETLHAQVRPSYCVIIYGQRHTRTVHLYDTALPFLGMFGAFLSMVSTGVSPVPETEVVRLMEIVFAVQEAGAGTTAVQLPPL